MIEPRTNAEALSFISFMLGQRLASDVGNDVGVLGQMQPFKLGEDLGKREEANQGRSEGKTGGKAIDPECIAHDTGNRICADTGRSECQADRKWPL